MTNKKEWDQFVRSKDRFKVHDYYQSNRIDCFNMWLDCDKNWDKVQLEVERLHAQETEAKQGVIAVQGKTIKETHSSEKAAAIIAARKTNQRISRGMKMKLGLGNTYIFTLLAVLDAPNK